MLVALITSMICIGAFAKEDVSDLPNYCPRTDNEYGFPPKFDKDFNKFRVYFKRNYYSCLHHNPDYICKCYGFQESLCISRYVYCPRVKTIPQGCPTGNLLNSNGKFLPIKLLYAFICSYYFLQIIRIVVY
ncbi:uncharacterized protein LOC111638720 [Centruroides sculpturatus]|uniref:uncharacterized protein LOC111638720 n=1 Tax=Centruroides sculpturatus TaxID=218467 RepID=UPI000C6E6CE5|nr:uncharacterized protein LOC111638720 [Centruroides sculpturatus]